MIVPLPPVGEGRGGGDDTPEASHPDPPPQGGRASEGDGPSSPRVAPVVRNRGGGAARGPGEGRGPPHASRRCATPVADNRGHPRKRGGAHETTAAEHSMTVDTTIA